MKCHSLLAAVAATLFVSAAALPDVGPAPIAKPAPQQSQDTNPADHASTVPVPEPKPDGPVSEGAKSDEAKSSPQPAPPAEPPVAAIKDEPEGSADEEEKEEGAVTNPTEPKPALSIAPETDADHQQCEADLKAMGAVFKDIPRIDDGNGCGIDKPISIEQALPGIAIKPEGTMRCQTALALAHWMKESVLPAAAVAAKDSGKLTTINQASTYVCKLRNSAKSGKISEHARGNAIDVASFSFEHGPAIAVQPRKEDSTLTGAFQRAVSAAACLYFRTVLDPQSDAAHQHHFHLDILDRKGDFRYCH